MTLRRGFKAEANWYARDVRADLGLMPHDPLCPRRLAGHLGYEIEGLSAYARQAPDAAAYLRSIKGQEEFSAITVCVGNRRLIIHNDTHHPYRQTSNIAHEVAHGLLLHATVPLKGADGARIFNKEQEAEAHWLGPSLLISEEAALFIAEGAEPLHIYQHQYGVSDDLLRMRLQVTGALMRIARRRAA